jgi:FkbM family methyltransferase
MMETTLGNLKRELSYLRKMISTPNSLEYSGIRMPPERFPPIHSVRRSIYRGEYQAPELKAVKNVIQTDDVVVEFGAGVGIVSMAIARRLSDSSNLTSYEGNHDLRTVYFALAAANKVRPVLVHAVVGRFTGEAEFFIDDDFVSSSVVDRGRNAKKCSVPMIGIDAVLTEKQPTAIVFDIEGAEVEVLDIPLPDHVQVLCGELHPKIVGHTRVSQLVRSILSQGFELCLCKDSGYVVSFVRGRPVPNAI